MGAVTEWAYVSDNVVSALVNTPSLIDKVSGVITAKDLVGRAEAVYRIILDLHAEGVTPDVTILQHAWFESRSHIAWGNSVIADLYVMGVTPSSLDYHLDRLLAIGATEQLGAIGTELVHRSQLEGAVPQEIAEAIMLRLGNALTRLERPHDITLTSLEDIRSYRMPPQRWLFPEMLKRQQRVMFVAGEGLGKSTLLAQMAFAGAAGMMPFRPARIEPIRTLIVDAENSYDDAMENWQAIDSTMRRRGYPSAEDRIAFEAVGRPLNLTGAHDQAWLRMRVEAHRPDLMVIGPLYMLTEESLIEDSSMTRLLQFLARLRDDYDMSLVIESHAGNESAGHARQMRPYGASVQRRNMEFGFGLARSRDLTEKLRAPIVAVEPWRGGRRRKSLWPTYYRQASNGDVWWDDASEEVEAAGSAGW